MTGPTHVIIGVSVAVISGRLFGWMPDAWGFICLLLGSLAPDIDGEGSIAKPGQIFKSLLGWKVARLIDDIFKVISSTINFLFGHRGITHSLLVSLIFFIIAFYAKSTYWAWFAVGYFLHLLADFFTKEGIPWLSPFKDKKFSGSSIKVGSLHEKVLFFSLIIFVIFTGWPLLPEEVKQAHTRLFEIITEAD